MAVPQRQLLNAGATLLAAAPLVLLLVIFTSPAGTHAFNTRTLLAAPATACPSTSKACPTSEITGCFLYDAAAQTVTFLCDKRLDSALSAGSGRVADQDFSYVVPADSCSDSCAANAVKYPNFNYGDTIPFTWPTADAASCKTTICLYIHDGIYAPYPDQEYSTIPLPDCAVSTPNQKCKICKLQFEVVRHTGVCDNGIDEGVCYEPDHCDATGTCVRGDPVADTTKLCDNGVDDGVCYQPDHCDGSGNCVRGDPVTDTTKLCDNGVDDGVCYQPDHCDGSGNCVRGDPVSDTTTSCDNGVVEGECYGPDHCNGLGSCVADPKSSGTTCGAPVACYTPNQCDGSGVCAPGSPIGDGTTTCTVGGAAGVCCSGGTCTAGTSCAPVCSDPAGYCFGNCGNVCGDVCKATCEAQGCAFDSAAFSAIGSSSSNYCSNTGGGNCSDGGPCCKCIDIATLKSNNVCNCPP